MSFFQSWSKIARVFLAVCFVMCQMPYARASQGNYPAWVNMGGKVGNHSRYLGLMDVFVPVTQSPGDMVFVDLRGKDASGSESEYNLGGGYRRMINDTWILGVYGYYDNLRSSSRHNFEQGTLGVEALTQNWDFRMNGYFPEPKKVVLSSSDDYTHSAVVISGHDVDVSYVKNETIEQALPGFDGEVGYRLPGSEDIRVYAGGFYFHRNGAQTISGPRARTEWRLEDFLGFKGTRLTIEGEYSHDQVRNDQVYGGVSVRIPFGPGAEKSGKQAIGSLDSRMVEPIVRDVDVVSATATKHENLLAPAINPETETAYSGIWFADAVGGGNGTLAHPETLAEAIDAAGINGIIAALDANGNIDIDTDAAAGVTLKNGQLLIGSMGTIHASNALNGYEIPTVDSEGEGTVVVNTNEGAGNIITLAQNNTIQQLTIDGGSAGLNGISGENVGNVHLDTVDVKNMGNSGVVLDGAGNVLIENSFFSNNGDNGINIYQATGDITVNDTTADDNGGTNLYIDNDEGGGDVFVSWSEFNNDGEGSGDRGIDIKNVAGRAGVWFTYANGNRNDNISIDNVGGDVELIVEANGSTNGAGASVTNVVGNVLVQESSFDENNGDGLVINHVGNVEIDSSNASASTTGYGINIQNADAVTLTDVTADENSNSNLYVDYADSVSISSSEASFDGSTEGSGIEIYDVAGNVDLTDVIANDNTISNIIIDTVGSVTMTRVTANGSTDGAGIEISNVGEGTGAVTLTDVIANNNQYDNLYINTAGDVWIGASEEGLSTFNGNQVDMETIGFIDYYFGGIDIQGSGNVIIDHVTANGNTGYNVSVDGSKSVALTNVTASGSTAEDGIDITNIGSAEGATGNVTLTNVVAENNNVDNLYIETINGSEGDLTINTTEGGVSSFSSTGGYIGDNAYGMEIYYVSGNTLIENVTADGNGDYNLYIDNDTSGGDVTINSSSFSNGAGIGMYLYDINGTVALTDVTASDNNGSNIVIIGVNNTNEETNGVTLHGVVANNSVTNLGLDIEGVSGDVLIDNPGNVVNGSTFNENTNGNMYIYDVGNVGIDGVKANMSSSGTGLYIEGANGITVSNSDFEYNDALNIGGYDIDLVDVGTVDIWGNGNLFNPGRTAGI